MQKLHGNQFFMCVAVGKRVIVEQLFNLDRFVAEHTRGLT